MWVWTPRGLNNHGQLGHKERAHTKVPTIVPLTLPTQDNKQVRPPSIPTQRFETAALVVSYYRLSIALLACYR